MYKNVKPEFDLVRAQALYTIGYLAKAVGMARFADNFEYYTQEALKILEGELSNFNMRESAFGYFSGISKFVKEEMKEYLPVITKAAFETIQRDDIDTTDSGSKFLQFSEESENESEAEPKMSN